MDSGIAALIDAGEATPDPVVRAHIIRSLVAFGLDADEWRAIGPRVLGLLDVPPATEGRWELVASLTKVPLASVRRRLDQIANDSADPDRHQATLTSGSRVEEPILDLVAELEEDPLGRAVERLAIRPIEDHGVDPALFERAVASDDPGLRLWGAVAVARLGQVGAVDPVFRQLDEGEAPEFMWGSPWSAYDRLAAARPVPAALHQHLLELERPKEAMHRDAGLFIWALTGAKDAEGTPISDEHDTDAPETLEEPLVDSDADVRSIVSELQSERCLVVLPTLTSQQLAPLVAVSPRVGGHLLDNVIQHVNALNDDLQILMLGNNVMDLAEALGPGLELPVAQLVSSYVQAPTPVLAQSQFAFALTRARRDIVMEGLAQGLLSNDEYSKHVLTILDDVAGMAGKGFGPRLGAGPTAKPGDTSLEYIDDLEVAAPPQVAANGGDPEPVESSPRVAYPRVDCATAVVVDIPFDVVIGLAARPDRDLVTTGKMLLPPGDVDVDLLLTYDPESLKIDDPLTHRVRVTAEEPYPFETVRVTALYGEDLAQERRLGVHFLVDGSVVGFAWRTIVVVDDEEDLAAASRPNTREHELLDLGPVAVEDAPDLLLAVYRSDDARGSRFAWAAFPADPAVAVPDVKRSTDLGEETAKFATNTRRTVQIGGTAEAIFDWFHGIATQVGDAVPEGIVNVIRAVAERPDRTEAATVLLLTEEVHVPWELAVFRPPLETQFGGASPFLGAHVAIARWLLRERKPRPTPPRRVDVRTRAVVTAKYADVTRWPQLPAAEEEAAEIERAYPPTSVVAPLYEDVMNCLRGKPQADVMHFALHGQFDPDGVDEGLVLLAPKADGGYTAQYLQAAQINTVEFAHSPFVFLNACQVGTTKEVLGDYAGIASAFLGARAAGVVAPLWNVDDRVASSVARDFYEAAYAPDGPHLGELMRRVRAKYTREAVSAEVPDAEGRRKIGPTLIAYQLFGHPRLRLVQAPLENGDEGG